MRNMTSRSAWIVAWMGLVLGCIIAVLGRPQLGAAWLVMAAISFWMALRRGGRPWRRDEHGRFPDTLGRSAASSRCRPRPGLHWARDGCQRGPLISVV